jgi:hypothetical protein
MRARGGWAAILQVFLIGALIPLAEGAEPEYRKSVDTYVGDAVLGGTSRIETRDIPATIGAGHRGSKSPRALTYVTLNLLHGGFLSGLTGHDEHLEQRLGLVIRGLRAIAPDVVGLQEASMSHERGNVAARLAAELGFQYVYAPALFHLFDSQALNDLPGTAFTGRVLSSRVVADRLGRLPDGTSLRASDHSAVLATIQVFPSSPRGVTDKIGATPGDRDFRRGAKPGESGR